MSEYDINRVEPNYMKTHLYHSVPLPSAVPIYNTRLRGYNMREYFDHANKRFEQELEDGDMHWRAQTENWNKDTYKYLIVASYSTEYLLKDYFRGRPATDEYIIRIVSDFFAQHFHNIAFKLVRSSSPSRTYEMTLKYEGLQIYTYLSIN